MRSIVHVAICFSITKKSIKITFWFVNSRDGFDSLSASIARGAIETVSEAPRLLRIDKKVKFVEKINAVQETDNLDDMEFHDTVGFPSWLVKWDVSSRWSSSLFYPMRNSVQKTIGKTHSILWKSMNENFYKRNQSKMHFDTNRKYYNVNELLDEVQDLRDRARHIRKKRTKDGFQIKSRSLNGHRIFGTFLKTF